MSELQTRIDEFVGAVKSKLTADNWYVNECMPETGECWDEGYDENGNREWHKGYITKSEALKDGINSLVNSELFDEFVHCEIQDEVTKLIKVIFEEKII